MRRNGKSLMISILLILCIACQGACTGEAATGYAPEGEYISVLQELLKTPRAEAALPENEAAAGGTEETEENAGESAVSLNEPEAGAATAETEKTAPFGEAKDITGSCLITLCSTPWNSTMITDKQYTTYWDSYSTREPWLTIHSETPMYGLYLCFRRMPTSFTIEVPGAEEGEWLPLMEGDTRFHHSFYALAGISDLRIRSTQSGAHKMGFNELYVFGRGDIPDWVQRWEPAEGKADILFFSAHPDDEILFYGGAIPTYASERKKRVVVAYLSYSNTTRRSEVLNGLWAMGVRHYPEFGGFQDTWSNKTADAYRKLGKKKVLMWVAEMYRKHQPDVVVTHDLNGEYGHGQHKMLGDAAIQCYDLAANPEKYPESYTVYGTWQVRKLYVHLWGDASNQTCFDWNIPLESMGGKTGLEVAREAYDMHVTQASAKVKIRGKWHLLSVDETGTVFSNTTFGLYASQVGPDETHTDFLEHIENN